MLILQRYVLIQAVATSLAAFVLLSAIMASLFFAEALGDAAAGQMPPLLLGRQVLLRMPGAVPLVAPLALFAGILLTLGRLSSDRELTVMRAVGLSPLRLLRGFILLGLVLALPVLATAGWLAPRAAADASAMLQEAARSALVWGLQPGQFTRLSGQDAVIFVEELGDDDRTFTGVFLQQDLEDTSIVITARRGQYWADEESGQRFVSLFDGQRVERAAGAEASTRVLKFRRNDIRLPELVRDERPAEANTMTLPELAATGIPGATAEIHGRIAAPLSMPVLAALALGLGVGRPKEGRFARLGLGLLVYMVYANLVNLAQAWLQQGQIPAWLGLWWVHGLAVLAAVLMLRRFGASRVRRAVP